MSAISHARERIGYLAAEQLDGMIRGTRSADDVEVLVPPIQVTGRSSTEALAVDDLELMRAIIFIREYAYEQISVDEIAESVPMTRRALERKFRAAFDRSPMEQVRLLRLARARDLLANTDLSVATVAFRSGFNTGEYLAKSFNRYYMISPLKYRKKFR